MDGARCPAAAAELVGKRWNVRVVGALVAGHTRFNVLREEVPGITAKVLADRLRELEAAGIVERSVEPGQPVRIEYRLTRKGEALRDVIEALDRWAATWHPDAATASRRGRRGLR